MICRLRLVFVSFSLFVLGSAPLWAQSGASPGGQSSTNPSGVASPPIQIAVTGCLKRSHDGGYYLADRNGTIWRLSSSKVNLDDQLMHVVTVTGRPGARANQDESSSQQSGAVESSGKPSPSLQVLTLKMLSNSCTR